MISTPDLLLTLVLNLLDESTALGELTIHGTDFPATTKSRRFSIENISGFLLE